jgi:ribosomal protein S6--L-glutamate ligase
MVIKLNWGGQGETVFKVDFAAELDDVLHKVRKFEATGQYGFMVQEFIPSRQRSLRVAAIGSRFISYWRRQAEHMGFGTSVLHGAVIDHRSDIPLQEHAKAAVRHFCHRTGLQLAGFDFIFNETPGAKGRAFPLILEVNYFFGRSGLGGSQRYYEILTAEVDKWLAVLSLHR